MLSSLEATHVQGGAAYYLVAGWDGSICRWGIGFGEGANLPASEVHAHKAAINGLAIGHEGLLLCSCSNDGFVRVWNASTMKCTREIDVCTGAVKVVACRANLLFYGGHNGVVYQVIILSRSMVTRL